MWGKLRKTGLTHFFLIQISVINNSHVGEFSLTLIYRENWKIFHRKSHYVIHKKGHIAKLKYILVAC